MATVNLSQSSSPEGLKEVIAGRIQALANVCSLFAETRWIGAEVSAIATQELAPFSDGKRTFTDGPQTLLAPDAAQAVAVALHELATNAAKYGALSTPEGHVRLDWSHAAGDLLRLRWMETGGPVAQEPTRTGFGTRIVEQMIVQQKGKVRFDWRKEGLCLRNHAAGVSCCVQSALSDAFAIQFTSASDQSGHTSRRRSAAVECNGATPLLAGARSI